IWVSSNVCRTTSFQISNIYKGSHAEHASRPARLDEQAFLKTSPAEFFLRGMFSYEGNSR
ncbi:hypothetical protein NE612_07845, partial [Oscillibacter valericigenes]|nr:hypothetical protein [Oscillibacter valericigenes]